VVDADGQPVPGAKVGFNHEDDPASKTSLLKVMSSVGSRSRRMRKDDGASIALLRRCFEGFMVTHVILSMWILRARSQPGETSRKRIARPGHVFHLGQAVVVHGIVVTPDGQPIANAKVFAVRWDLPAGVKLHHRWRGPLRSAAANLALIRSAPRPTGTPLLPFQPISALMQNRLG